MTPKLTSSANPLSIHMDAAVKFRVTPICRTTAGERTPSIIFTFYGPTTMMQTISLQDARDLARALNAGVEAAEALDHAPEQP